MKPAVFRRTGTRQVHAVIRELATALDGALPIIGVGGFSAPPTRREKNQAGASLVAVVFGLIYRGPDLVGECVRAFAPRPTGPGIRRGNTNCRCFCASTPFCRKRNAQSALPRLQALCAGDCQRQG